MSALPSLAEILDGYRNTALVTMGQAGGWFKSGVPKAEMVQRLAGLLADPAHVRAALAGLDPAARAVLVLVQQQGGVSDVDTLYELLHEDGVVGARGDGGGYYRRYQVGDPWASGNAFPDVLARLEVVGLLMGQSPLNASATVIDFGASAVYLVPQAIAPHLPPPPPLAESPPPALAREVAGDPEAFGRQQYLVWSYLWRHRPRLLRSGLLGKRDLAALAAQMDPRPDATAARDETALPDLHFHRRLLEALFLVHWLGEACEVDEEGARGFWELPAADRAVYNLGGWRQLRGWNELQRLPQATWMPSSSMERTVTPDAVRDARATVAATMAELGGDGAWVGLTRLSRALRQTTRDFLVAPGSGGSAYAHRGAYGYRSPHRYTRYGNAQGWTFEPVADERQGWERVEMAFVRQVVDALHRMGACDVGLDQAGQVVAYRLGPLGRWLLSAAPGEAPAGAPPPEAAGAAAPQGARVVVQPNLHIVALGPVPVADIMLLESFADRVGTDRALEFALTRASVYRAQLAGQDAAAVASALERLSGQPVAQNVARTLEDWQRLHEQMTVHRRTTLLQATDAETMARVAAAAAPDAGAGEPSPALAPLPGSPTLARVLDPARVAKALSTLGLVAAAPADPSAAGSIGWDEDDTLRPRHATPSLYLLGKLQRLAEQDEASGRWRASAAAARRARAEHGLDAPAQEAAWKALSAGALPEGLAARLKAWCGHYPPAKLHRVVLVELPNAEALADVRADGRAKPLARRFQPSGPLLAVDEAQLEALRALLAEYGIVIKG